jgi:Zn-finger protein
MIANNRYDLMNNPTANQGLRKRKETQYSPIKTSISDLKDLNIICPRCTTYDKDKALKKVYMKHDDRNELYECPNCHTVTSDNQVRYAMRLELPEYIYYDKTKNIKDVKEQRESEEKFIIQPINSTSPTDLLKKTSVRAVKNKPFSTDIKK